MMLRMQVTANDVAALAIIAGLVGVWLTGRYQRGLADDQYRRARQDARADRRRAAYEDFMLAAGRLVWLLRTSESGGTPSEQLQSEILASVDETARIFVVVRFADTSEEACNAAARVVDDAHEILSSFGSDPPSSPALADLADKYESALNEFTKTAKAQFD
jgi:hypothetical protein